jgi:RND family efflux transporter MFP subunit
MKKISTKTALIALLVFAIIGVSFVFFLASKQKKLSYRTYEVVAADLVQTVRETGTVKASTEINLSFLNSGKIQRLNFITGDSVKQGQLLAELDYTSLVINKQEAQANFDVSVQNLNKLLSGATSEDRVLAEATVRQSEAALESAKNEMSRVKSSGQEMVLQAEKTLNDLESDSQDTLTTYEQAVITAETNLKSIKSTNQLAIDNYRDSAFTVMADKQISASLSLDSVSRVLNDDDGKNLYSAKNSNFKAFALENYNKALGLISSAQVSLAKAKAELYNGAINLALADTILLIETTIKALENTFSGLDNSVTSSVFSQAKVDSYKNTISTSLATMNSSLSSVKGAEQAYKNAVLAYDTNVKSGNDALTQAISAYSNAVISASNALNSAKKTLEQQITSAQSRISAAEEGLLVAIAQRDRTLAPANTHDISLARARIRQAQATLDSINKQIENSQIIAPIDGQITASNYKVGEQAVSGQSVFSLLGEGGYKIEVLISEADIVKVKVGDEAEVSLDALGDEVLFSGKVLSIEPAETVIQDVIYYLVAVSFDASGEEVRPGMTANVLITTNRKIGVFSVPSRAITDNGENGKTVKLLVNNQVREQKVVTGARGDGGNIEILDGLKAGDEVITQIVEN